MFQNEGNKCSCYVPLLSMADIFPCKNHYLSNSHMQAKAVGNFLDCWSTLISLGEMRHHERILVQTFRCDGVYWHSFQLIRRARSAFRHRVCMCGCVCWRTEKRRRTSNTRKKWHILGNVKHVLNIKFGSTPNIHVSRNLPRWKWNGIKSHWDWSEQVQRK